VGSCGSLKWGVGSREGGGSTIRNEGGDIKKCAVFPERRGKEKPTQIAHTLRYEAEKEKRGGK